MTKWPLRFLPIAVFFIAVFFLGVFRAIWWQYSATDISYNSDLFPELAPPSLAHPFGTTSLRQDVFVRIVDGFLTAVTVLSLGSITAIVFGIVLAFVSFVGGSWVDKTMSFLGDALYSIPSILIALAVMIGTPSDSIKRYWIVIGSATLGVMLFFGAKIYRTLRVNISLNQQSGYYAGAIALGLPRVQIFFEHLLPNSMTGIRPLITGAGSDAILTLAGLGFIGVGISATDGADWGYDLSRGINDISQGVWWTTLFPAIAISLTVLSFALTFERGGGNAKT